MINRIQALNYEVRSSWWAQWIGNERLQNLIADYFAWKVRRKMRRYEATYGMANRLRAQRIENRRAQA